MRFGKTNTWRHVLTTTTALTLLVGGYVAPLLDSSVTSSFATTAHAADNTQLSVNDFLSAAPQSGTYSVTGYVVGVMGGATSFSATSTTKTNLAIADSADEKDAAHVLPIALPTGSALQTDYNLADHPENLGQKVTITVTPGKTGFVYFTPHVGVPKDATISITKADDTSVSQPANPTETKPEQPATDTPSAVDPSSIAAVRQITDKAQTATITGTVVGLPGSWGSKSFYVQDGTAGIYVYTTTDYKLNPGDTVTVTGTVTTYNNTLEFLPTSATKGEVAQTAVKPADITLGADSDLSATSPLQQALVDLKNVTLSNINASDTYGSVGFTATDKAGKSIAIVLDNRTGDDIDAFNTFYKNGDEVNLTGILETYQSKPELKLRNLHDIEFTDASKRPAELKAPALIADIQGAGQNSPYSGETLRGITGVVTYLDGSTKVYIQDADLVADKKPETSDGIMVKVASNSGIKPGDVIAVDGTVKEVYDAGYDDKASTDLTVTEIINATATVKSTGNDLDAEVKPVVVNDKRIVPDKLIAAAN